MKKHMFVAAVVLFAVVLVFSSYQLLGYYVDAQKVARKFDLLSTQIRQEPSASETPVSMQSHEASSALWTAYDSYGTLFAQNSDMVGWVSIEGTELDYPVMQSRDRPGFYLDHDFEGAYSASGVPYVDEACTMEPQSDNLTIYGHHMQSGQMFATLERYKSETFCREHPTIRFDTRAGFGTYEVIAAFKVNPADFRYNLFADAADAATFDEYVQRCASLSFYDTGKTVTYGDNLITLSTCEYSHPNNRLVIVARRTG
jgi:sortase B